MGYKFNPFTGNLDVVDTTAAAGSTTEVQFNNSGVLDGSADLTWDDTGKVLGVGGNVGIGTSAPSTLLHTVATEADNELRVATNTSGNPIVSFHANGAGAHEIGFDRSDLSLYFKTVGSSERIRITQAGAVLFARASGGLTTPGAGFIANTGGMYGEIVQSSNGISCLYLSQNFNSGTQTAVDLRFNNTQVGTINVSSSATNYTTSSDYRLKENVVSLIGAIDRVNQLQVHRFNFIADPDKTVDGFLAHEVQTIVPEAITGEKDAVDDDGNPIYQGIDQSKLVPLLTAAFQEAIGEIKALKDRVTALEGA